VASDLTRSPRHGIAGLTLGRGRRWRRGGLSSLASRSLFQCELASHFSKLRKAVHRALWTGKCPHSPHSSRAITVAPQ
jgi:hypothetical protein